MTEDSRTLQLATDSNEESRSPDQPDVARLVAAAASGDGTAWNALVDKFSPTVWAIARGHRLSSADAADVSQTTWLRLVENLHRIQQPERVGAWLAVTARRGSLRVLRVGARQTPTGYDFDVLPAPVPVRPPEHAMATQAWGAVVAELVQQLPTRSQVLLRLLERGLAAQLSRYQRGPGHAHRQHRSYPGPGPRATPPARGQGRDQPG